MDSPSAPPQPADVSQNATSGPTPAARISTASIVATMLQVSKQVSDLIFSPSRAPQIELNGQLREVNITGVGKLTPDATRRIAVDLIGKNELVSEKLEKEGATDLSYSLPGIARFRVNIFRQRGTYAIVMRVSFCLFFWGEKYPHVPKRFTSENKINIKKRLFPI